MFYVGGPYKVSSGRPLGWTLDGVLNPQNLKTGFSPSAAVGSTAKLTNFDDSFEVVSAARDVTVAGKVGAASGINLSLSVISLAPSLPAHTLTMNVSERELVTPAARYTPSSVVLNDSGHVERWTSVVLGGPDLTPPTPSQSPQTTGNWTVFESASNTCLLGNLSLQMAKTIIVAVRPGTTADACCSGVVTLWNASNPTDGGATTNGIALKRGGSDVLAVLDYAGENDGGRSALQNTPTVLSVAYNMSGSGSASLWVDGCEEILVNGNNAHHSTTISVGYRASDTSVPGRHLDGSVAEILIFNSTLNANDRAHWENQLFQRYGIQSKSNCAPKGAQFIEASLDATTKSPVYIITNSTETPPNSNDAVPSQVFVSALQRIDGMAKRVASATVMAFLDAALGATAAAIDGLYRTSPPVYLHGAMAWDVALVGWRSQYGATCWGWTENVAAQGSYFFGNQVTESNWTECSSDPSRKLTVAAPHSRFYGKGRVHPGDGMYDMQSQMFDQQIHLWRWTGNRTHEGPLRSALELHVEWAEDCFDADGDGLYTAYINTWPTDTVWFNGGAAPEQSGYMFRAHTALRDMALRANDAVAAAKHGAMIDKIATNFRQLWIQDRGHPAAYREEIGHQRLRPDAWLYSVCIPIEAGLLRSEDAAQALFFTEWGLQRDPVFCEDHVCGVRVWTSNWVPSIWSVREFWPGDNYMLALSYFKTGLPDAGWEVLYGNLRHDMYDWITPGDLGAPNGGTDFNDIVHPFARSIVEGLCGFDANYPNGTVEFAPQFPSAWPTARFKTPYFALSFNSSDSVDEWNFTVVTPASMVVQIPIRSARLAALQIDGALVSPSDTRVSLEGGFGQGVLCVYLNDQRSSVSIKATLGDLVAYSPAITLDVKQGSTITLSPLSGFSIIRISDPQNAVSSVNSTQSKFVAIINATVGHHMVFLYMNSSAPCEVYGCTLITQMVKLNVSAAQMESAPQPKDGNANTFSFVDMSRFVNANASEIYYPRGGYVSPRPSTCSVRIGTDGYSGWTFTYGQGNAPPKPSFSNVQNLLTSSGFLNASGVLFDPSHMLGKSNSIAFTSMWDNYPTNISVPIPASNGGDVIWVLIAGSTNPMQTLLPNAQIRLMNAEGDEVSSLDLTPPTNFWSLSAYGGKYYDYDRDGFCLPPSPPPQVNLGADNNAMIYGFRVPPNSVVTSVVLETLSLEVVIGVYGISVQTTQ